MRYGRSAIVTAIAAIASAGALAFAPVGPAAAVDSVTGIGTTTCSAGYTGQFTFSPALKTGGTSTKEEVGVQLSFTGCAGGAPVPVSGLYGAKGIVSGAGANNCANWFAPAVGITPGTAVRTFNLAPLDGDVAWSPSNISQSNVRFGSMRIRTRPGATNYLTFKLPNAGAGVVTGSYVHTSQLVLRVTPVQTYAALSTACTTGVSAVKIVPSSPAGSSTGTW